MRQSHIPKWIPTVSIMCLLLGLFLSWEFQVQAAIREATADHRVETMVSLVTNLESEKGFLFFQRFLKEQGILDALEEKGIQEGDTVRMYGLEFDYYK